MRNSCAEDIDFIFIIELLVHIVPSLACAYNSCFCVRAISDLVEALHRNENSGRRGETGVCRVSTAFDLPVFRYISDLSQEIAKTYTEGYAIVGQVLQLRIYELFAAFINGK